MHLCISGRCLFIVITTLIIVIIAHWSKQNLSVKAYNVLSIDLYEFANFLSLQFYKIFLCEGRHIQNSFCYYRLRKSTYLVIFWGEKLSLSEEMLSLLGVHYHFRLTSVHYVKSTKQPRPCPLDALTLFFHSSGICIYQREN